MPVPLCKHNFFQIRQATCIVSLSLQSSPIRPWLMYSFICDPRRYFVRLKLLFPFTFLMSSYLQLGKLEFILARPFPRENKLSPQNPTLSPTYFPFPALKTYNFYILGIQFLPRGNDFHRRIYRYVQQGHSGSLLICKIQFL